MEKLNKSSWNTLDSIILNGWKQCENALWLFQTQISKMTTPLIFILMLLYTTCFLLSAKEPLKLGPTETQTQRIEIGKKVLHYLVYSVDFLKYDWKVARAILNHQNLDWSFYLKRVSVGENHWNCSISETPSIHHTAKYHQCAERNTKYYLLAYFWFKSFCSEKCLSSSRFPSWHLS